MPTYEYACRDCGEHLEVVQSFADGPLTVCGACGGTLRKVFSAAGIIFKGSGYYVTDTREKAGSASSGASGGASGSSDSGSDAASKSDGGGSKSDSGSKPDGGSKSGSSEGSSSSSGEAKSA